MRSVIVERETTEREGATASARVSAKTPASAPLGSTDYSFMKRRILHIISIPDNSELTEQAVRLAEELSDGEFDVRICVLHRPGPLAREFVGTKIPVDFVTRRWAVDPLAFVRVCAAVRRFKPDLVQTWGETANLYGRKAAIRCNVPKIVLGLHQYDRPNGWFSYFWNEFLDRNTDRIVSHNSSIRDFCVQNGCDSQRDCDSKRFSVVPSGVVPLKADSRSRAEILERLGIPRIAAASYDDGERTVLKSGFPPKRAESPFLIGMIGDLTPHKRIKDAIWACETLKFAGLDYHLLIFGDGPERERLIRYRDLLTITDRVHFPGNRPEIDDLIPHFDLFWQTGRDEGPPVSVLKAMSAGIPVLACDLADNRELIANEESGILIPEFGEDFRRRRSCLVELSLRLLGDDALRRKIGEAAAAQVRERFDVEKMIAGYAEVYREVLRS